jgi:hypothetical protein
MLLIKNWSPATVRFDLGRLNWIGSINSEVALTAAWHTAPHKTAKDLFDKELIVGGTNFMTVVGNVRVLPEDLASTAKKLRPILERLQATEAQR